MMLSLIHILGVPAVRVNNAGITRDGLLVRMKPDQFDAVVSTNLKGTFNMTQIVGAMMLRAKAGSIVSLSSVVGISGNAGQANYAASKAGVIGLTKSAAKELGARGVRVNAVAPGFIESDMTDAVSYTHLSVRISWDVRAVFGGRITKILDKSRKERYTNNQAIYYRNCRKRRRP